MNLHIQYNTKIKTVEGWTVGSLYSESVGCETLTIKITETQLKNLDLGSLKIEVKNKKPKLVPNPEHKKRLLKTKQEDATKRALKKKLELGKLSDTDMLNALKILLK